MDTAFYTRLTVAPNGSKCFDFQGIEQWFKGNDLLLYEYIFFPINQSQAHWTLVVINMHDKCIEYYDSLLQPSSKRPPRKPTEFCGQILHWFEKVVEKETAATQATIDLSAWQICAHRRALNKRTDTTVGCICVKSSSGWRLGRVAPTVPSPSQRATLPCYVYRWYTSYPAERSNHSIARPTRYGRDASSATRGLAHAAANGLAAVLLHHSDGTARTILRRT
jgi:hypothetical protein